MLARKADHTLAWSTMNRLLLYPGEERGRVMVTLTELNKLLVCVLIVAGGIFLLATGKIDAALGTAMIMTPIGYVFGNGHGILSAKQPTNKRGEN